MKVKIKYLQVLNNYLLWRSEDFILFNSQLTIQDDNALTPEEIMMNWESVGTSIPSICTNPELLAKYVQGKKLRDFWITEWRNSIKQHLAFHWEFIQHKGPCNLDNYKSIFNGVLPKYDIVDTCLNDLRQFKLLMLEELNCTVPVFKDLIIAIGYKRLDSKEGIDGLNYLLSLIKEENNV